MITIGIADLAIAKMINVLDKKQQRSITFTELNECKIDVKKMMEEKTGKTVLIISNRDETNNFLREYRDVFHYDKNETLILDEKITLESLKKDYITYKIIIILEMLEKAS